jgi:hypothetical protein
MQEKVLSILGISLQPAASKVSIDITLESLSDIELVDNTMLAHVQ